MFLGSLQEQTSHDGSSPPLCDIRSPQPETQLAKCFCQIAGLLQPSDNLEGTLKGDKDPAAKNPWHQNRGLAKASRSSLTLFTFVT
jgi:hypothetical protein